MIFDPRRILIPRDPRYTTLAASATLMISAISSRFRRLLPMIFGSCEDFDTLSPPVHDSRGIYKTHAFGHFWPFLWVITHDMWSWEDFDAL